MTPTHQLHGVFLEWSSFLESNGYTWRIQGCKAMDTLGEYKDAQFMGELFIKVIEDVGVDSCVQIITDNAPVCKAAGMIVEAKYP